MPVLVEAHGLSKSYPGGIAVDQIDLSIESGEVFGLLGPNGAGKTTTVLMLLGLTEPDTGTVAVVGLDPTRHPLAVKRHVGYMPDTVGFYERLTARQNMRFAAELNELETAQAEARIEDLLDRVGLAADADRPVGEFSRGMRQRLGLADTLLKDPRVVILDEPMVGIDPAGVTEMQALIAGLAKEEGRAVLLTSHMLHQVQQTCDRIAIFVKGRVVALGSPRELATELGEGQSAFEIGARAGHAEVEAALSDAGLGADIRMTGTERWRVSLPSESARDLLPALLRAGLEVRGFRDLGSDLDEIYHRYFMQEIGA